MAEDKESSAPPPPPSKLPRLFSEPNQGVVTMVAPSPLVLGLGTAQGLKPAFTFMQLQELEHQSLIYKHMAAGVPVPLHLVLPIWKSVAASSFGLHPFPSLMGLANLCYDYRSSMEPEPGRCRRTDGKKWRCSRDVVPGQKYCERHMHRGRNRSRKPVEQASVAAASGRGSTDTQMAVSAPEAHAGDGSGSRNSQSPPMFGFSPTSILQSAAAACTTGPISRSIT